MRIRSAVAACALAALVSPLAARAEEPAPLPDGVTAVRAVEGITEYRLDNGLAVLLFPDPSKQTITVNITYLVGSKHERYGETGMAHLLEHLVFKGTPKHRDIAQELTDHGARPNGTTWFDRTNYFETFAASDENLEWALDLEADRMVNSFIAREDLDSEMTVVRNEFEMGENYPRWVLMDRMMSTAYLWHNYGNSTIGARSDIERVPIDNLQAFYRTYYQPDNAVLVVAGNFDRARTLALVAEKFGAVPKPERALPRIWTAEPAQDGERMVVLRRVGDLQVVGAAYHVPAGSHPDYAAAAVLSFILGDTPSGRLHHALVETRKAAAIDAVPYQLEEPGVAMFFAEVRKERSAQEALDAMLAEIEGGLGERPASGEEVARARTALLKDWETTVRDSERAALELSEWASMGDWRLMFLHRDRLEAVSAEDVARVAAAYFRPENRTAGLYVPTVEPQRAAVPAKPDVAAMLEGYAGREEIAAGEAFDPDPAAIEAMVQRRELAPGIRLAMLPKETRGNVVQVVAAFHLGDLESLTGRGRAGELAAAMLTRGTSERSRQQIRDDLDRMKAQLRVFGTPSMVQARLEVPREHLADALRLLAEALRRPSFPESELALLAEEEVARLEESLQDPIRKGFVALQRHLDDYPPGDPRHVATAQEAIAATREVTAEDLRAFHRDFYGASAARIVAVGDFDPAALEPLVAELFGDWESLRPFVRIPTPYVERTALAEVIATPDKESAVFAAGARIALQDDDPDYPALVMGNFLTGGGFISSRLADRLRQQDGLCYGVGSSFDASSWEPNATFFGFAIYAPQNAARLEAGFREEIAKVLAAGFTPEEVAAGQQGWLQQRKVSRVQEDELAGRLAALEHLGRTLDWDGDLESAVAALTPEQIHAAMKKHLSLEAMSMVKAGDFAEAAAGEAAAAPPEP